ncbi:MAG: hypothetical protein IJ642_04245 [Oscillospiraceae bacterium]|nr:hypothetical protein [Oscillospiraceae bacterium]
MMQNLNILGCVVSLLLGVLILYISQQLKKHPEAPVLPPYYEGKITKIKWTSVTVQFSFQNHEIEWEFPRVTLPSTISMRVGMPVKVFYSPESGQSYVYSVGKPNLSIICLVIALVMFTIAVLFFTAGEV